MPFAFPIAFLLASLAVPIVGLYILKVRLRRVPVSTNLFWSQIYDEKKPRSIWQNLRHLMSLVAQLFMLSLLVFAIADPYLPWQTKEVRRVVLIIDPSASMQATDVKPTRFSAAIARAHQLVAGLRESDQAAIVLATSTPEVVVGMTNHSPTLRRAIESIQPKNSSTFLKPAIELGKQLIGVHPDGEVIVLTDGCTDMDTLFDKANDLNASRLITEPMALATGSPPSNISSEEPEVSSAAPEVSSAAPEASAYGSGNQAAKNPVRFVFFGEATNNVGITAFQTRRTLRDIIGYEIMVVVVNASTESVQTRLEITLNDLPVDIIPLRLQPGERWTKSLEKTSMEGGTLKANLSAPEPIPLATVFSPTNVPFTTPEVSSAPPEASAYGSAKISAPEPMALATDSPSLTPISVTSPSTGPTKNRPLNGIESDDIAWATLPGRKIQKVLLITPGNWFLQKVFEANSLVALEVRKDFPETWPSDTIIVFHRSTPAQIIPGNVFVIDPESDSDLWSIGGVLENPIVTEQADESPLMTHIRMDNVLVPEARKLQFTQPPKVLAGTVSGDSVYSEIKRSIGKCLVLGVNMEQSDLAFRTSFPIMVSNALSWFSNQDDQLQPALSTGSLMSIDLPSDQTLSISLISPSGKRSSVIARKAINVAAGRDPDSLLDANAPVSNFTIGPLDEIGIWKIVKENQPLNLNASKDDGALIREVAVNLSNERESDLRPHDAMNSSSPLDQRMGLSSSTWFARPLWFYLAFVACVFTAIEWFLYQRRLIS